ncbi:MAG: hypothetical protein QOH69_3183 [Actinomycetota bacterium]|jgi:hypothetical protein|nr:hypothetical protein [Actinomycetota bacterium]
MSISTRIVRIAAGSLPKALRDRYREQWLADARDAPEQNLRPAQIAVGSVAFAVTVGRPFPKRHDLTSPEVDRRVRIAWGLALSAAVLALSQYASVVAGVAFGSTSVPDAPTFAVSAILIAYAVLASVLALILAFATRRISTRVRWAIALFAAASASSIVQSTINSDAWTTWFLGSGIGYLVAAVLLVVGLVLESGRRGDSARNPRASIVAGAVVLLFAVATLANAAILWSLRAPLRFGAGPRSASNSIYVDWLYLKERFESLITSVFVWWGVGAVVLVVAIILIAIVRRLPSRGIVRLAVGAVALTLIAGGGLLGFIQDAEFGIVPLAEFAIVLSVGRLALVVAILSAARASVVATDTGGRNALTGGETTPPTALLLPPPAGENAR